MTIRRDWQRGETVPIWATVKLDGVLTDPSEGVLLTVTSPTTSTKVVDAQAMTKSVTGVYYYKWASESDSVIGWYKCTATAQDGTGANAWITIEHGGFRLYE